MEIEFNYLLLFWIFIFSALPELDGKTAKMYRGGKICLSAFFIKKIPKILFFSPRFLGDHFKPLWARLANFSFFKLRKI